MQGIRNRRWIALAVLFVFAVPAARAGMITPDSIPNPPNAVGSANGTPVSMSNIVTTQYEGLGLRLSAAITILNGASEWVPISYHAGPPWGGAINYSSSVGGRFLSPASANPTTVSSVTLDIIGNAGTPTPSVYGLDGLPLNIVPVLQSNPGPDGGQIWTFSGTGINQFYVSYAAMTNTPWGVSQVSFTPASAPEPSSLVLAGLGALGLATRLGWRRIQRVA